MENRIVINNQKYINGYQLVLQALLLLLSLFLFLFGETNMSYLQICYVTVIDILLCLLLFVQSNSARLVNAKFLFWAITTIFSFGQNIAYIFIKDNAQSYENRLLFGTTYSANDMILGTIFTLLAYNFFSVGLASNLLKNSGKSAKKSINKKIKNASSILLVGKVLFVISVLPEIMYLYAEIKLFLVSGYGDSAASTLPGFVQTLHYWFIPSVLICYIGKAVTNKKPLFETFVLIFIALLFMTTGDRGNSLALLLVLIWLRCVFHYEKKKTIYLWCLLVILLVPFVKFFRIAVSAGGGSAMGKAMEEMLSVNPFIDILLELGSTQQIVVKTMKKVAIEGYAYGTAYLDFVIKWLPGFFNVPTFYGNLAQWVINTDSYQTAGFSIWGEAYLNFGMWGIPFMFFIGKVFGVLFSAKETDSSLKLILTAVSLSFFADVSRRSVSEFGFIFLYDIIFPIVAIYICDCFMRKKDNKV